MKHSFLSLLSIRPGWHSRILWIAVLTLGWYVSMLLMETPRGVLLGSSKWLDGRGPETSFVFCILTACMITGLFFLAPGIPQRGWRFLFGIPFPFVAATGFVFGINFFYEIRNHGLPSDPEFYLMHLMYVPLVLAAVAWLPLVVMLPVTIWVGERFVAVRREEQATPGGGKPEAKGAEKRSADGRSFGNLGGATES